MTFWQRYHKQVELARDAERKADLVKLRGPAVKCKMDRQAFLNAGRQIGVDAAHLAAVAQVESGGIIRCAGASSYPV